MSSATRNPEFLQKRPIGRLLWEFSAPSIIASTVSASYNLVARIFVGQKLGTDGIAALHVSFPFMLISLAFAMMIGTGASTLISIRLGRKENDKAEEILGQAVFMYLILSLLFLIFGLCYLEPMLKIFGASETILPLAKSYLSIIIWGTIFQELSFGVNNFIRIEGKPRIAMTTMIVSAVINMVLDYVFLFIFKTGIWGAAASNIIALATTSVWILWLYFSGRTVLRWRLRYFRFNLRLIGSIALFGTVPLVTQACGALIQGVQNNLLGFYGDQYGAILGFPDGGDVAIGIMGTVFSIWLLVLMPLLGLSQGMQPIVGYNLGAKRPDRVHRALRLSLRTAVTICVVCWLIIMIRPEWLVIPFLRTSDPNLHQTLLLGGRALRITLCVLPLIGVNVIASSYFQAHGRPFLSLMLALLRQMILLLPCLFLLPFLFERLSTSIGNLYGLDGIWGAYPLSDFLSFFIALLFLIQEYKAKRRAIYKNAKIKEATS